MTYSKVDFSYDMFPFQLNSFITKYFYHLIIPVNSKKITPHLLKSELRQISYIFLSQIKGVNIC